MEGVQPERGRTEEGVEDGGGDEQAFTAETVDDHPGEGGQHRESERGDGEDHGDQRRASGDTGEVVLHAGQYGGEEHRPEDGQTAAGHEHDGGKTSGRGGVVGMVLRRRYDGSGHHSAPVRGGDEDGARLRWLTGCAEPGRNALDYACR